MPSTECFQLILHPVMKIRFMKRCRDASTEDEKAQHYINILISSAEYDTFVKLMRIMRPVAEAKQNETHRADTKHSDEGKKLDREDCKGDLEDDSDAKAGDAKEEDEK